MKLSKCDLCGGNQFQLLANTDRHKQPLDTVICECCGLVRHATIPSEQELQRFYSSSYRQAYHGECAPGTRRIMRAWKNGERICRQLSPELSPSSRVLEVGAGIGCTVKVFERAGYAAEGIDPGGEFLNFSRSQLNSNVTVKNLYELPLSASFDSVLLVHVIEHLRSPARALRHIAGLLKPGGMLFVECPNLQAPFAIRGRLFHSAHIYNFVPSSLKMLADSCGFRLHKQFGDDRDGNLQMLFRHTGDEQLHIDGDNYRLTRRALRHAHPLPYYTRRRYWSERVAKISSYLYEHIAADSFVRNLIASCQAKTVAAPSQPPSQAA